VIERGSESHWRGKKKQRKTHSLGRDKGRGSKRGERTRSGENQFLEKKTGHQPTKTLSNGLKSECRKKIQGERKHFTVQKLSCPTWRKGKWGLQEKRTTEKFLKTRFKEGRDVKRREGYNKPGWGNLCTKGRKEEYSSEHEIPRVET